MGWLLALVACGGCTMHIDRATTVTAGSLPHPIYAVDGAVQVLSHAHAGKIRSVDGGVTLDDWATAHAIKTVDGRVMLGRQSVCRGVLASVDGNVTLARGARVGGDLRTYTANVQATDAQIGGSIRTVSGRIELRGITHVAGSIRLDKPKPSTSPDDDVWKRLPVLVIGPGVAVDGAIVAQRGGTLWVSRHAHIGAVSGIRVQWFDGAEPPLAAAASHGGVL
ncbi:hypothetical protein [Dyella sp. A6]|uniref:hypothetical protein n=1 Tax=Dyella aluminiiresistens TaxID=3069105 RepID=UPI002E79C2F8|nr:hypothetical protein [Dyella sp. A6]